MRVMKMHKGAEFSTLGCGILHLLEGEESPSKITLFVKQATDV